MNRSRISFSLLKTATQWFSQSSFQYRYIARFTKKDPGITIQSKFQTLPCISFDGWRLFTTETSSDVESPKNEQNQTSTENAFDSETPNPDETKTSEHIDEENEGSEESDGEDDTFSPEENSSFNNESETVEGGTIPVLDSFQTKDLREEDEIYQRHQRTLEDFIDFSTFVKWPQFEEAFDSLGDRARFRHIVAAFAALREMAPRPPNSFLDYLSKIAVQSIHEARSNHISRLFYSCGKLRYINEGLMDLMAKKMILGNLPSEMDGCDISMTVYSIAILSRFQLLVYAAEKGMKIVDVYQLYSKETPPVLFESQTELIQKLAKEISTPKRLTTFKEQELANIVYGLGLLRAIEPVALAALAREIANPHRLLRFSAQELSNIVYGFGLVNLKDEPMLYALCNHLLRTGRIIELETRHLANILYGFSRMGFAYPPILGALIKEITKPDQIGKFKEQELANIVSCSALIGIQDDSFYKTLGREIIRPHRLSKYLEHNFSTMILGFATVGVRDVTVLKTLAEEMKRPARLPNYTSKDICDVILGFNNLEFLDDGFMLGLVAELRKPRRITQTDSKVWQSCRAHVFSWSLAFPF